jgi:hypothetical protein
VRAPSGADSPNSASHAASPWASATHLRAMRTKSPRYCAGTCSAMSRHFAARSRQKSLSDFMSQPSGCLWRCLDPYCGLNDAGTSQLKVQRQVQRGMPANRHGQAWGGRKETRLTLALNTKFSAELRRGFAQARPQSAAAEPSVVVRARQAAAGQLPAGGEAFCVVSCSLRGPCIVAAQRPLITAGRHPARQARLMETLLLGLIAGSA